MQEEHTYIAIDLKSFYASAECVDRGLDPLTTNLVVADVSRTEKTICLAVSPSLKQYGIPGRPRLFEVVQRMKEVNRARERRLLESRGMRRLPGDAQPLFSGKSSSAVELEADPSLKADYLIAVPRMAYYIGNECFEKARAFGRNVLDGMFLICVPTLCGLFFTSDLVIKVFSGGEFIRAATPLRILSIALVFAVFANFYVNCILMALKKEKVIMTAAVISAVVNIVLNVLLIPFFGENDAEFTTVCAEVIICMIGAAKQPITKNMT